MTYIVKGYFDFMVKVEVLGMTPFYYYNPFIQLSPW